MEYGIPSAGALCVELLQQMRPSNSAPCPTTGLYPPTLIPRVQTIQTLSLLVSCLDWVSGEVSGMSAFYERMCSIIKRILDRVLAPGAAMAADAPPMRPTIDQNLATGGVSPGFAGLDFTNLGSTVESLPDILEWPEFWNWNQESWMDSMEESNFL